MSFYVWTEIVCAKCSLTTAGRFTTGTIPRKAMMAEAKKQGWVYGDTGLDGHGPDWQCKHCKDQSWLDEVPAFRNQRHP